MKVPILQGVYVDSSPDFRTFYPENLIPVIEPTGISNAYLRPSDGIVELDTGPGVGRGGINWNGVCYRAMGNKLVRVETDGSVTTLGDIGGTDVARFDYSFDRLGIASGGKLYYFNGALTEVTDPDLGNVFDMLWVDGYFMTTDGESLVVTDLNDPYSINPLKYGSSEVDPDVIQGLRKLRDEVYSINRYTIEVFDNIGGNFFPFSRIKGAQMMRGAIGRRTFDVFLASGGREAIAFLGSGRDESPSVWLGVNAQLLKLSTREIDTILQSYTEEQLSNSVVESRIDKGEQLLCVHLPDKTLLFDNAATEINKSPVWSVLHSGLESPSQYRARNFVWCYDKWICEDPTSNSVGYLTNTVSSHYGDKVGWSFGTMIFYNSGLGAIIHDLELVTLPGRVPLGVNPTIWTSYSKDGETWSQEKAKQAGTQGQRNKRICWMQQGNMGNWRIQKFRGTSDAHLAVANLEARIEPLNAGF